MRYYHYEQSTRMRSESANLKLDAILQKNFPDNNKWGACVAFDKNNKVDFIEINKLSKLTLKGGSTWTHYATIGVYKSNDANNGTWELYSQFNGKDENELWVLGYYKNFGDAVRRVKLGIENLKPIKIY